MKHLFIWIILALLAGACAPIPTAAATLAPLPTPTPPPPTETPVPTLAPGLTDALGTAPYEVGARGHAQIEVRSFDSSHTGNKETQVSVEIVSAAQVDTAQFSSVPSVTVGKDAQGGRYFYTEGFGWMKLKDVSLDLADPAEVPYILKDNVEVLNTRTALYVAEQDAQHPESPIIAEDAVEPHYNAKISPWHNQMDVTIQMQDAMPKPDGGQSTQFTTTDKLPFAFTGIYRMTDPKGNEIIILSQTRKNSGEEQGQLINLFFGMDGETYQSYMTKLNASKQPILEEFLEGYTSNGRVLYFFRIMIRSRIWRFAAIVAIAAHIWRFKILNWFL
jgi:hypothetical protein